MNTPEPTPPNASLGERVRSLRLGDRQESPGSRLAALPWAFVVVLGVVSVLLGYRAYRVGGGPAPAEPPKEQAKGTPLPKVSGPTLPEKTPTPMSSEEVVLQSKGYVVPESLKQISPRIGGILIDVNRDLFKEGMKVKEGTTLAWIDPTEFDHEVNQAQAAFDAAARRYDDLNENAREEIIQAEADLEEVRNNAQQMKLELDRNMKLVRGSAIAQRELEQVQYNYQAMAARQRRLESNVRMLQADNGRQKLRIAVSKAEREQAKARLDTAKMRRDWCVIKAPITGTILTKKAEQYNLVNPSAFSSGISASLCEMADLTRVEVDLAIQERDVALLRKGQACLVMPEAFQSDKTFLAKHPKGYLGYISRLMPTADRAKGAIPVRVWVKGITDEEAGVFLKPDMGALVSFLNRDDPDAK